MKITLDMDSEMVYNLVAILERLIDGDTEEAELDYHLSIEILEEIKQQVDIHG